MTIFRRSGVRACVVQTSILQGDKERNWDRASALLNAAMAQQPQLVVLPEAFVSGVNFIVLRQMAEPIPDGPTCVKLRRIAETHRVHLVAGILESGEDERVYDSAVLIDPGGDVVLTYRRRFLWIGERSLISPGLRPAIADTPIGRISLIVGYDICFPEALSHGLAEEVDVIVCAASVFRPLSLNVTSIAATRAMDHHCYVLYANCVGFHQFANMTYGGGSGIFCDSYFRQVQLGQDPSEAIAPLAMAGRGEEVIGAELFVADLADARRHKLPFRADFAATAKA